MTRMEQLREAARGNTTGWSFEDKAACYNQKEGDLQGYDCPVCRNKGNTMVIQDGYEYFRECDCMEVRRGQWRLERSGLKDMARRYGFAQFKAEKPHQETMKAMALAYCQEERGWFYIGGQPGSGKTHLCTAIANAFIKQGIEVRYMLWMDEAARLKGLKQRQECGGTYEREMEKWKTARLLYIDDFFKTRRGASPTDADINLAFEIVNARYNDQSLLTVFSGERTLQEIIGLDEALGSRIYQRCGKYKLSIGRGEERNYRFRQDG